MTKPDQLSPIQELYKGKTIFITGGSGFMGKVSSLFHFCWIFSKWKKKELVNLKPDRFMQCDFHNVLELFRPWNVCACIRFLFFFFCGWFFCWNYSFVMLLTSLLNNFLFFRSWLKNCCTHVRIWRKFWFWCGQRKENRPNHV